ncbi:MAG: hypothetical protein EBR82_40990 [Caulobacteraceae bacterium]|nr:hypothetical protein [Caulobacteraceae bacterium]
MAEMVQPDVVGNYLAAYNSATDRRTAAADRQRNMQRQDVADQQQAQQFQFQMDDRQLQAAQAQQEKFSRLALWADTPEKWAQATQMAEAEGSKGAGGIPFEKRGAKLAQMLDVKTQLDQEWKRREFALKQRETEANINQSNAAAEAARSSADATRSRAKMLSGGINPETGQPMMKLTESQSKDLAFYQRGTAALNKLTDDRIGQMISSGNAAVASLPFGYGNAMVSPSARQGKQAAADFLAAILRKDSGAALTQSDFDVYGQIFMPVWGDDPVTLAQKAESRKQALESLRAGLGTAEILAQFGPQPNATTPPPADGNTTAPAVPPPPPGARMMK